MRRGTSNGDTRVRRRPRARASGPPRRERGVVLLAMLTIVLLAVGAAVLSALNSRVYSQIRAQQRTALALAEARDALIGWAVVNPEFPGGMPFPDRNGDGDYDGRSDCTSVATLPAGGATPDIAIGRLPWLGQTAPCQDATELGGLTSDLRDGAGERLWYAVSANLLRVGNGTALVDPRVDWFDPFGLRAAAGEANVAAPAFDWLTVRDASGAVLSDRVAFVVIAPGAPVFRGDLGASGRVQERPIPPPPPAVPPTPPGPDEFLDTYTVGGVTYDNADTDGDFIMVPDTGANPDAQTNLDGFNDRLVYVTVDELLPLLARRVLREVGDTLLTYRALHGSYPWPAPFDDTAEGAAASLLTYMKSYDPGAGGRFNQATDRFGWLAVHRPYLDDRATEESFETPLLVTWNSPAGGIVNHSGTVSEADLRAGVIDVSSGSCVWRFVTQIDCTAPTVVVNITPGTGSCPGSMVSCTRSYDITDLQFEGTVTAFAAPDASRPRTRSVTDPVNGIGNLYQLQMTDVQCTTVSSCSITGTGSFLSTASSTGSITVSDVRYDVGVVDDAYAALADPTDLPEWYVGGGWHRMVALALASGHEPGGVGTCTVGTDCLELETVDDTVTANGAVDNTVAALLLFTGRLLDAGAGTGYGLDEDPDKEERYFEAAAAGPYRNDDDDDDYVEPESMATLRTLLEAEAFNDQVLVVQ